MVETLAAAGWRTVSADEVARQVASETAVRQEIAATLGLPMRYSREDLRALVAADHAARHKLNSILHARTVQALMRSQADVVEVPLLFEAGLLTLAEEIWTVWCAKETQLERLAARLGDAEQARLWVAAQLPSSVKAALSDWSISTDRSRDEVADLVLARARRTGVS